MGLESWVMVQKLAAFSRGSKFDSQHSHVGCQPAVTPLPEDSASSCGLHLDSHGLAAFEGHRQLFHKMSLSLCDIPMSVLTEGCALCQSSSRVLFVLLLVTVTVAEPDKGEKQ